MTDTKLTTYDASDFDSESFEVRAAIAELGNLEVLKSELERGDLVHALASVNILIKFQKAQIGAMRAKQKAENFEKMGVTVQLHNKDMKLIANDWRDVCPTCGGDGSRKTATDSHEDKTV